MNFGVDLKGDLARFCIVVKQPWLNLKDIRVAAMNKTVKGWYDKKMLTSLIQQCGRCTRDKNDYSRTYILDGFTLTGILKRNINFIPMTNAGCDFLEIDNGTTCNKKIFNRRLKK